METVLRQKTRWAVRMKPALIWDRYEKHSALMSGTRSLRSRRVCRHRVAIFKPITANSGYLLSATGLSIDPFQHFTTPSAFLPVTPSSCRLSQSPSLCPAPTSDLWPRAWIVCDGSPKLWNSGYFSESRYFKGLGFYKFNTWRLIIYRESEDIFIFLLLL